MTADGAPLDGEEILLDGNELAGRPEVLLAGRASASPDGRWLAYSTDFTGGERFTIRIKDLDTGEVLADEMPGTFYGLRLVAGRLGAVLRHRRRRLAAVPGAGGTWSAPRRPTT